MITSVCPSTTPNLFKPRAKLGPLDGSTICCWSWLPRDVPQHPGELPRPGKDWSALRPLDTLIFNAALGVIEVPIKVTDHLLWC